MPVQKVVGHFAYVLVNAVRSVLQYHHIITSFREPKVLSKSESYLILFPQEEALNNTNQMDFTSSKHALQLLIQGSRS